MLITQGLDRRLWDRPKGHELLYVWSGQHKAGGRWGSCRLGSREIGSYVLGDPGQESRDLPVKAGGQQ